MKFSHPDRLCWWLSMTKDEFKRLESRICKAFNGWKYKAMELDSCVKLYIFK